MVPVAMIAVYVVMAAAVLGGVLLLWSLIEELVQFDRSAHPARSARVSDAYRSPGLAEPLVLPWPRDAGGVGRDASPASSAHKVRAAAR